MRRAPVPSAVGREIVQPLRDALELFVSAYPATHETVYGLRVTSRERVSSGNIADPTAGAVTCNCDPEGGHNCALSEMRWAVRHAERALDEMKAATKSIAKANRLAQGRPEIEGNPLKLVSNKELREAAEAKAKRDRGETSVYRGRRRDDVGWGEG